MPEWKRIAATVVFISTLGAAISVIKEYRWWPWKWEFDALEEQVHQVAGISFTTAINQKWDILLIIQERLRQCEADRVRDCTDLRRQAQRLESEIRALEKQRDELNGGS